jgi:hypothetical protein
MTNFLDKWGTSPSFPSLSWWCLLDYFEWPQSVRMTQKLLPAFPTPSEFILALVFAFLAICAVASKAPFRKRNVLSFKPCYFVSCRCS